MASSYATFLMFLCVAIVALTAPSAANLTNRVNLNGALVCARTGTPVAPNITVLLTCGSQLAGSGVVLDATTTATGTVSASATVGPRTRTAIKSDRCVLLLPPQACPGSPNVTLATTVTVNRSGNMFTVTPSSQVNPLVRSSVSA